MGRNSNGRSSIYEGSDGSWHGRVTVGIKDDGKADRRHVRGKTKTEVTIKVRNLEKLRDQGRVPKAGQRWRVAAWLHFWVGNIACPPNVSDNTYSGYEVDVRVHLIPGIGAHWLDKLATEHVEKLYMKMMSKGLSAGTAHHVHRTIRNALNEAVRRGHIPQNPVLVAKAPRLTEEENEPYTIGEVRQLLTVAGERRNGPRWVVALALGLRQGEALGLKWEHIDLQSGMMRIRRNRLRPKYEHGCGDACGRKAGYCPERKQVRADTGPTKSRAGRRTIGLPEPLIALLRVHQEHQEAERIAARQLWHDEGWVFAKSDGRPLNPNTDYHEWKALLDMAGLREGRLHDARHTAGTVLLLLQVPTPTAMSIMGWSSPAMAKRYQHVLDAIRKDVATQVGELLWESIEINPANDSDNQDDGDGGAAGVLVLA